MKMPDKTGGFYASRNQDKPGGFAKGYFDFAA